MGAGLDASTAAIIEAAACEQLHDGLELPHFEQSGGTS